MGQKWPCCDLSVLNFINKVVQTLKEELQSKLHSIILHGSLSMGSFYPPKSDIDLIVVVSTRLETKNKKRLLDLLAKHHMNRPIIGGLELSILTEGDIRDPSFPMPYELHFSSEYAHEITNENYDPKTLNGKDLDLSAHMVVSKYRGVSLYGHDPKTLIGNIPWSEYISSVLDDLNWIIEDEHILETPFYSILNSCRVLQMLMEDECIVPSKEEGAVWAINNNIPDIYHPIVRRALECYQSSSPVSESDRRTGGKEWDRHELLSFRDYVRGCRNKCSSELKLNHKEFESE